MLDKVQQRRRAVVQGFLWALLAIGIIAIPLNFILVGSDALSPLNLVPNLLMIVVIGVGLYLNRTRFSLVALGMILVLTIAAPTILIALEGLEGAAISLLVYIIPLSLTGLLLGRKALLTVGSITLLLVFLVPTLQSLGLLQTGLPITTNDWSFALQFALVYSVVLYFLERFGSSLNEALAAAAQREEALQQSVVERWQAERELLGEKSLNEAIIAAMPGVFVVLDADQGIVQSNHNLETVTGYTSAELSQLVPSNLITGIAADLIEQTINTAFEIGRSAGTATLLTRSGEQLPYMWSTARFRMNGSRYLSVFGIDLSELEMANERIQLLNDELGQRLQRLTAVLEVDKAVSGSLELNHTLDVVLEQMTSQLGIDAAAVLLYRPQDEMLVHGSSRGFRTEYILDTSLGLGQGLAGGAARTRQNILIDDPYELAATLTRHELIESEDFKSYMAVPLVARGRLQGVLELFQRSGMNPTEDWLNFLETVTAQTAIALNNAALVQELERTNEELLRAYDATIEGWAGALDLKDEETEGHSRRVTDLTVSLARRLGLPEEEITHIRRGALLHDIGKMGIPDAILLKPDKLTDEERSQMEQHTTYAFELLKPITFLQPALDIPYSHHEWWDGSGYPLGLKGEQIPLAARVFAVVDVFDALTSDRPYRAAWTAQRACDYLQEQAGTQFEPRIVTEFLQMIGVIHDS